MKKMTKIESARIIVKRKGDCRGIKCLDCFRVNFCDNDEIETKDRLKNQFADAEAYIKRHESKTKKKDHIVDKHEKVTRPNFRKYLRDKIDMKVRVTPELSEELQKIAGEEGIKTRGGDLLPKNTGCRIIRFYCCDHYSLVYYPGVVTFEKIEATEYNPKTDTLVEKVEEPKPIKTVGIDNSDVKLALTAQYEPVKDCPVNSEIPDPIRVDIPDIFYCPTHHGILRFKRSQIILKDTNNEDCLLKLHDEYPCYRTLEEAVIVAKKLWNGEGK